MHDYEVTNDTLKSDRRSQFAIQNDAGLHHPLTEDHFEIVLWTLLHELKTPLMAISMAITNLINNSNAGVFNLKKLKDVPLMVQDIILIMERCATDAESHKTTIRPSSFELNALIEDVLGFFESSKIKTIQRWQGEVETDYLVLKMIIMNFMTNAIKYSAEGTSIRVEVSAACPPEKGIDFLVWNQTGHVGPADPEQVFKKNYRSDFAKALPGRGHGLWLCQKFSERLGAKIELIIKPESTCFKLNLPHH